MPRLVNANIIRSFWICRNKKNSNGFFARRKARSVGDGASQQTGIDCGDTFNLVVKLATIRIVLSLDFSKSWCLQQLDVKNTFLHGHLSETVYMHQSLGFRDSHHPNYVCLLQKYLYSFKQSPHAWYQRFANFVRTMGFTHSVSNNSLFIYHQGNDIAYLLLYVDDIILTTSFERFARLLCRH